MKFHLSSTDGSSSSLSLSAQVILGITIVAVGFGLAGAGNVYFFVLLTFLAVVPLFFTRFTIHLFIILLILDVIVQETFSYGGYRVLGFQSGFFDVFILISAGILFVRNREKFTFKLLIPFLAFITVFLLSVLFHPDVLESGFINWQRIAVENFLILVLAMLLVDSIQDARTLLYGTIVVMSLIALYFFYRYWQQGYVVFFGGGGSEEALKHAFPISSDFRNKSMMAAQVVPVMVILSILTFELRSIMIRTLCGTGAVITFIVILIGSSRGAFLAASGGILFYLIVRFRMGRLPLIPILFIVLVGGTLALQTDVGDRMINRFFTGEAREELTLDDYNRVSLIETSAVLIKQYPLLGIGFSELKFFEENKKYNFGGTILAHPHNSYLQMWVFGGTLTLIAFLWVLVHLMFPVGRVIKQKIDDPLLIAVAAAITGLLLDFGTGRILFVPSISHTFFILLTGAFFYARFLLHDSSTDEQESAIGEAQQPPCAGERLERRLDRHGDLS